MAEEVNNTENTENGNVQQDTNTGAANTEPEKKYSEEECIRRGINESMIHVDFMIGSSDMNITGITANGERVAILKDGNWAF